MGTRLTFSCDYLNPKKFTLKTLLNYQFHEIIDEDDESTFTIYVCNREFFKTEGFNTLEFLQQYEFWKDSKGDFSYTCIDTDENPLISFKYINGFYKIYSPWQKFSCDELFSYEELMVFEDILDNQGTVNVKIETEK